MSLFMKRGGSAGLYPPRIACFVCGAEVPADYPLYPEPPQGGAGSATPHFPFLLTHEPPSGCRPPSPGGVAKSCRVCYSTLMRQWDEYEKGGVSTGRRVYWLKRVDGLPFPSPEAQVRVTKSHFGSKVLMGAPALPPLAEASERLKASSSPLTVATGGSSVSPLATPLALHHQASPSQSSSSAWSRRPIAPPSASSAPSSLIQLSSDRGESSLVNVSDTDSGALDLSSGSRDRETMKSRSSVASHMSHHSSSYQSEGTSAASSASTAANAGSSSTSGVVTDILDLTLPDKNAAFEVCYVCGEEFKRGTLSYTFARQVSPKEPFYPSLLCHPRPPRSRPVDSAGRVQTCDECHDHLVERWHTFEAEEVPHADRNYALRKRQTPVVDTTTFVCYICALDYHSSSLRLLYSRPNTENEPYYPFIEQQRPPPGASPISPQGMVQVCMLCYKSTKEKHHGFMKADQPPPKKRRGNSHTFSLPRDPADGTPSAHFDPHGHNDDDEKMMPADITCPLCRRRFSIGSFKFLHSLPPPAGGLPYFPFLSDLPRPEEFAELEDDKQSRVRACQACTTSLINQWTTYQREQVPVDDRNYLYQSLTGQRSSCRPPTPSSIRSHKSGRSGGCGGSTASASIGDKPARPRSNSNQFGEGTVASVGTPPHRARSNTLESKSRSETHSPRIPLATQQTNQAPHSPSYSIHSEHDQHQPQPGAASSKPPANASSFYCFLCGLHSELSFSRMLYSTAPGKKAPYFPFMKKHVPKNRAETLREDGTALVCTFCYHSVMVQWARYNEAKPNASVEPSERTYNLHDYRCYVCGITTYRKRIRALRVVDFPFLRHHKPRKGVITMENGEMVAVCLDCFESLRGQFIEGGKYGIPVEKRQYNWMQIPPPPDEGSSHILTPQERLLKVAPTTASPLTKPTLPPPQAVVGSGKNNMTSTVQAVAASGDKRPES